MDSRKLKHTHKPPYDVNAFVEWATNTFVLLTFSPGLDIYREMGAILLKILFEIHCICEFVRYKIVDHIVKPMHKQFVIIKEGSTKIFRFTSYLCHLLLEKYWTTFKIDKLQI